MLLKDLLWWTPKLVKSWNICKNAFFCMTLYYFEINFFFFKKSLYYCCPEQFYFVKGRHVIQLQQVKDWLLFIHFNWTTHYNVWKPNHCSILQRGKPSSAANRLQLNYNLTPGRHSFLFFKYPHEYYFYFSHKYSLIADRLMLQLLHRLISFNQCQVTPAASSAFKHHKIDCCCKTVLNN